MKRYKIWPFLILLAFSAALVSCRQDEIDPGKSVFDTDEKTLTGFDKWIDDNYRVTYNIRFRYKYADLVSDMGHNLIPARMDKATQAAQMMKFLWLDAYTEVAGLDFTRANSPRIIALVGSPAYNSSSVTMGTAEQGLKVNLYDINNFDPHDGKALVDTYCKFMYHEFAHILHQTKMYDRKFAEFSRGYYTGGGWQNVSELYAAKRGFVSRYSQNNENDDFAEIFAAHLTKSDEWWDKLKAQIYEPAANAADEPLDRTPDQAWAAIRSKVEFVREYMMYYWRLDIDNLREVIRRRAAEAATFDLITEF